MTDLRRHSRHSAEINLHDRNASSRKKPGVAFWATVVVVVALACPLSFGPACRLSAPPRDNMTTVAPHIYWPIGWLAANGPSWSRDVIFWYVTRGWRNRVVVPSNWDGTTRFVMWPGSRRSLRTRRTSWKMADGYSARRAPPEGLWRR